MTSRRMSLMSVTTEATAASRSAPAGTLTSGNIMASLNEAYNQTKAYHLDAGTSIVVNTWATAASTSGPTVDASIAEKAVQHAIRRAEDGCVVLASAHKSCPSTLIPFLRNFPVPVPETMFRALEAIQPFLRCVAVDNPLAFMHDALAVTLTLGLNERLLGIKLALSQTGINTRRGLLEVPRESGNRAFDVFYYLLTSVSSAAEREFLGLKSPAEYSLLNRTGTYVPPAYIATADDGVAADDFRAALRDIGIKGESQRSLITTLAALLKLGDTLDYIVDPEVLDATVEDVAGLLSIEPDVLVSQCSTEDRVRFAAGLYEALVDWVIAKSNAAIAAALAHEPDSHSQGDTVCVTVLEIPNPAVGKGVCMRGIFDDSTGINAEMFQDGLDVTSASSAVAKETKEAVQGTGPVLGKLSHDREIEQDMQERVLERIAWATPEDEFVRKLLFPTGSGIVLGKHERIDLKAVLDSSRAWYHVSLHPIDGPAANLDVSASRPPWIPGAISHQIRAWRLTEWGNRRNRHFDFTADFEFNEFVTRFAPLGCREGRDGIESWVMERGWSNGAVVVGNERVWMRENAWWEAETLRDMTMDGGALNPPTMPYGAGYSAGGGGSGYFGMLPGQTPHGSSDHLVAHGHQRNISQGDGSHVTLPQGRNASAMSLGGARGDYGLGFKGDRHRDQVFYNGDGDFTAAIDAEKAAGKTIETAPIDKGRRAWVAFVWALTFWIPSPLLTHIGRMRRPDVRMAWREKVVLVFLIFLANAAIVFWIIAFGRLLCPNQDKAWLVKEVNTHQGEDDFWVSIRGRVYDISKFWRIDHSDTAIPADQAAMQPLAGLNLNSYFVPPLTQACPGLGISERTQLIANNTPEYPTAMHTSGYYALDPTSALHEDSWYYSRFTPRINEFYKGDLVWLEKDVKNDGRLNNHEWFIWEKSIYDLTDYYHTQSLQKGVATYEFLDSSLSDLIKQNPGQDLTELIITLLQDANSTEVVSIQNSLNCIKNRFYVGIVDFRVSAKCQFNNYIMLAFTIILCAVILTKFLAALQFGSKRKPAAQDKFVICQVPAYTEGEDSLRKALDSLTGLAYDNKRKLICVICDGVLIGQGNERPTPKIVLDILGVDPKLNPPQLAFKSVGAGSDQLNYGKVYSGLYEYEGNVVPYLVVVKVGKESEQASSKPGNRGKRDSQILLMSFLNRVHHRAPMNPLELEMFHQINNIIGVDPELYEYLLMVDADTCVAEDSLTRLVAACANDKKISGICGETSLENDEKSWWTMIQVYEYFISHHLAKAFESLFGSVTCLPGCFTMYRLRTADQGKPLIISDAVINDYSVCDVDTLHKKNLLSLGEDRYLTTLMTKHFPHMSNKFIPAAQCKTAAPESWSVLLSQRRRWINSTIHNLVELMRLRDMCGFCCFSMRFVVFIDLFGTIILPATCAYLGYLIYLIASRTGQFPLISLIMLAAVYGLQALVFILKRQWQHIGWMIIYILAFPIYSFILPIYSFWNQDNFSWGNTRVVLGEQGDKKVVAVEGEPFDPRSIPLQRWDDYALLNNLPGRRGDASPPPDLHMDDNPFEKEGSVYSGAPGSFRHPVPMHMPPSPGYSAGFARNSTAYLHEQGIPMMQHRQSMASMGGMTAMGMGGGYQDVPRGPSPYQDYANPAAAGSMSNLRNLNNGSPSLGVGAGLGGGLGAPNRSSTALSSFGGARPTSGMDFQRGAGASPDDLTIVDTIRQTMMTIDLDNVTKKQLRTLVEQRLQTTLSLERKAFVDTQIDVELQNMQG